MTDNSTSEIVQAVAKWRAARAAAAAIWAQPAVEQTSTHRALNYLEEAHEIEQELICSIPQSHAEVLALHTVVFDVSTYRQLNPDPFGRMRMVPTTQITLRIQEWLETEGLPNADEERYALAQARLADLGVEPKLRLPPKAGNSPPKRRVRR